MSSRTFDDPEDRSAGRPPSERARRAPGDPQYRAPESEEILHRVIKIIAGSPSMPMSATVRVNKEEVLELLEDAVSRLPDELRTARWLLRDREDFLAKNQRDADRMIADAQSRVAHLAQRSEVVKAAERRAAQIVEEAEESAKRMRRETEDYCDQRLASFENVLARISKNVSVARRRLAAPTIEQSELGQAEESPAGERPSSPPVFDQDQ